MLFFLLGLLGCSDVSGAAKIGWEVLTGEAEYEVKPGSWAVVKDEDLGYGAYAKSTDSSGYACRGTDDGDALIHTGETIKAWSASGTTAEEAGTEDPPKRFRAMATDGSSLSTGSRTPSGSSSAWGVVDDHSLSGSAAPVSWEFLVAEVTDDPYPSVACTYEMTVTIDHESAAEEQEFTGSTSRTKAKYKCRAGGGRFQLVPADFVDTDGDGVGTAIMRPVLLSGSHPSSTGWVSKVTVLDWGDVSELTAPVFGDTTTDGDDFLGEPAAALSPGDAEAVLSTGRLSAEPFFLLPGIDGTVTDFPEIGMSWTCDGDDSDAAFSRRAPGYAASVTSIAPGYTAAQQVILRPDIASLRLGIELRGAPHAYQSVALTSVGDAYSFEVPDVLGISAEGTLSRTSATTLGVVLSRLEIGGTAVTPAALVTFSKIPE